MYEIRRKIKDKILNKPVFIHIINHFFLHNKVSVKTNERNKLHICRLLKKSAISIFGTDNYVEIGRINGISKIKINIYGNHNQIIIADDVFCGDTTLWIEDDNNKIHVGAGTIFSGQIHLSAIEGTKIEIGKNCLFSTDIDIRTGDGHSVLNYYGLRTNQSKDVVIKDRVWCGKSVSILKGGVVDSDSIIATRSVVTKPIAIPNAVIAGSPAKVIKQNISWSYERK